MLTHPVVDSSDLAVGHQTGLRNFHIKWKDTASDAKKAALAQQFQDFRELQKKLQGTCDLFVPWAFLRGAVVIKMDADTITQAYDLLVKKAGDRTRNKFCFSKYNC